MILGLALVCAAPSHAWADAPSAEAGAEARRNEAKARFDEGVNAFREHRWADAVQAFRQADAIAPSAALSFNIAKAYEHLEDVTGALRWYRDFLRRSPQAANAGEVQARVAALAATLAQRGVQQLTLLTTPAGAAVTIDERQLGTAPLTVELAPGQHRAHLELPGYRAADSNFVLDARMPQDLALQLEPLSGAPPAPVVPAAAAPSSPRPAERRFGIAPYIVLGAGGAGLLGALGFELARRSAESAARTEPQLEYQQHYDAMQTRQTTARVLLGVGGALAITGGVLLLLNTPQHSESAWLVGCAPSGCGLGWHRSFQ
ncbi:MAG TPA: PEGA domain-containing protein [Polyangiaceae bacterium]|nr:PEGA domain-containing protein [Polyangiaceae bacterium]